MSYCEKHRQNYNSFDMSCSGCEQDKFLLEKAENILGLMLSLQNEINEIKVENNVFYLTRDIDEINAFVNTIKEKVENSFSVLTHEVLYVPRRHRTIMV